MYVRLDPAADSVGSWVTSLGGSAVDEQLAKAVLNYRRPGERPVAPDQ
jgi:hypothetical protein